jgi:hypothetical protein
MKTFIDYLQEGERGLWDNIHAKRKRIKAGSGERMRKPGSEGAPTAAALKASQNESVVEQAPVAPTLDKKYIKGTPEHKAYKATKKPINGHPTNVKEELSADEHFDLIEQMAEEIALETEMDLEQVWEELDEFSDEELLEACTCWTGYKRKPGSKPCAEDSCVKEETELDEAAVDAKGYKSSTGGLTQKGRDAYNRKEGSNLKAPVTTPPSKLKKGSKAANRRKSFCARMSGVEGPMRKPNGEPTRKALALRKWNC